MKSLRIPVIVAMGFSLTSFLLFLYSYTQVDLNLTLSRFSIWQTIQRSFQYIGYYMRPLSTVLYIGIIGMMFVLYGAILFLIQKGVLVFRDIRNIVILVCVILLLSYPAFSYDMFNYIFTAKTVLVYHKSPYLVLPQEFGAIDPWINFMRWIHLPSAYTPLWILLTLPPYLLGFGYLLLILWNIKILVMSAYLACAVYIYKILIRIGHKQPVLGFAIFALNPLVIIESLVSAHNDILMMALAMVSFYIYLQQKRLFSYTLLAFSIALKLMTIFLLPVSFLRWNRLSALSVMFIGFLFVLTQREVLPWYWVWIMPFVALLPEFPSVTLIAGSVSLGLLLRYAPYIYFGHWDNPVPVIKSWVTVTPIAVSLGFLAFHILIERKRNKFRR